MSRKCRCSGGNSLLLLILIVLQFRCGCGGFGGGCNCGCNEQRTGVGSCIDNSILFIIAFYYLACCKNLRLGCC